MNIVDDARGPASGAEEDKTAIRVRAWPAFKGEDVQPYPALFGRALRAKGALVADFELNDLFRAHWHWHWHWGDRPIEREHDNAPCSTTRSEHAPLGTTSRGCQRSFHPSCPCICLRLLENITQDHASAVPRETMARQARNHYHREATSVPDAFVPGVRLALLGSFKLNCDETDIDLPLSSQRLVAYLAVQHRPLLRSHVAGVLWPDTADPRAAANLRSAIWRLRNAGCEIVDIGYRQLNLHRSLVVDLYDAWALTRNIIAGDSFESGRQVDANQRLVQDLLPDWDEDWLVVERERLRQLRLHALECLALRRVEEGQFAQAVEAALAAVAAEPLRESAHRALIAVYLAEGNRADGLRQYERYRQLVRTSLGIEPSPPMEALAAQLRG